MTFDEDDTLRDLHDAYDRWFERTVQSLGLKLTEADRVRLGLVPAPTLPSRARVMLFHREDGHAICSLSAEVGKPVEMFTDTVVVGSDQRLVSVPLRIRLEVS